MRKLIPAYVAAMHWWRHTRVAASHAVVYVLLFSALFFLFGSYRPQADVHVLEEKLAQAREEVRTFANEIARRNTALNTMRARAELDKKTIALLGRRIDMLEAQSVHWQEQTAFYRHVLADDSASGEILIHALDASPDFTRQQWELTAVLARPGGKRKALEGSYYFEVVESDPDGNHIVTRQPPQQRAFSIDFYLEIHELAILMPEAEVSNLRLVVLDKKGKVIASSDMLSSHDDSDAENEANGASGAGEELINES